MPKDSRDEIREAAIAETEAAANAVTAFDKSIAHMEAAELRGLAFMFVGVHGCESIADSLQAYIDARARFDASYQSQRGYTPRRP